MAKPEAGLADMERFVDQNRELQSAVDGLRGTVQMESLFE